MNVAVKNLITGISEASQDAGRHPGWPNEKVAAEVIEKIAQREWRGPETLDSLLTKQAALAIEARLIAAANGLKKLGHAPGAREKTASVEDLHHRAASGAKFWMDKAAFDAEVKTASGPGSLTDVGPNTLMNAAQTDQMAALDWQQRPLGTYEQAQGADTTLPQGSISIKEVPDPAGPSVSPSISNSLTDHSAKAASSRMGEIEVYNSLKTAGLTEANATTIAKWASSTAPEKLPMLKDDQIKAASFTLTKEDQAQIEKAASTSVEAKMGVLAILGDRLHKVAASPENIPAAVVKQATEYVAMCSPRRKTAGAMKMDGLKKVLKSKGMQDGDVAAVAKTAAYIDKVTNDVLGHKVAADEDMPTDDGTPDNGPGPTDAAAPDKAPEAAPPSSDDQQMQILQQILAKLESMAPTSDDAQTAAAGLVDHPQGMPVLASIANEAKTAADVDRMLCDVLRRNPDLTKRASVETYRFIKNAFAKTASVDGSTNLVNLLKRAGAGSLTSTGDNTLANAAKTDELSQLDKGDRPSGYAEASQGKAPINAPPDPAEVKDAPRDGVPQVKGDNVVVREDKRAGVLSPEDSAYFAQLSKVAAVYGPEFPTTWTDAQKTAAIQALHACPPSTQKARLAELLAGR